MTAIDLSAKPINGRLPVVLENPQPAPYTPPVAPANPPAKSVMTPDQEYLLSLIPGGGANYKEIVKKGGLSGEAFRRAGNAVVNFFRNTPEREATFVREALGREPKNPAPGAKTGVTTSDISMFPQMQGFKPPVSEDALQRMRGVADFANSAKQLYGQKQQAPTGVDFLRGLFQQNGPSPVDLVNQAYKGTKSWGSEQHVKDLIAAQAGPRETRGQKVDLLGHMLGALRSQLAANASLDVAKIGAGEKRNPKVQDAAALGQFFAPTGGLGPIIQQHPELGKAISDALVNTLAAANQSEQPQPGLGDNTNLLKMLETFAPIFNSPVEKKAGGGEVGGGEAGAVPLDNAPVQEMDSGDYVIPVEVKRYYGSKFFQDLIEKADNAGLQQ